MNTPVGLADPRVQHLYYVGILSDYVRHVQQERKPHFKIETSIVQNLVGRIRPPLFTESLKCPETGIAFVCSGHHYSVSQIRLP